MGSSLGGAYIPSCFKSFYGSSTVRLNPKAAASWGMNMKWSRVEKWSAVAKKPVRKQSHLPCMDMKCLGEEEWSAVEKKPCVSVIRKIGGFFWNLMVVMLILGFVIAFITKVAEAVYQAPVEAVCQAPVEAVYQAPVEAVYQAPVEASLFLSNPATEAVIEAVIGAVIGAVIVAVILAVVAGVLRAFTLVLLIDFLMKPAEIKIIQSLIRRVILRNVSSVLSQIEGENHK